MADEVGSCEAFVGQKTSLSEHSIRGIHKLFLNGTIRWKWNLETGSGRLALMVEQIWETIWKALVAPLQDVSRTPGYLGFMKDEPGSAKDDITVFALLQTSNLMSSSCRLPCKSVIVSNNESDIMTAECSSSYGLDLVTLELAVGVGS